MVGLNWQMVRRNNILIAVLLLVLASCNPQPKETIQSDPLFTWEKNVNLDIFRNDSISLANEFYLSKDSCLVKQFFTKVSPDEQRLRIELFPKSSSSMQKMKSMIYRWMNQHWSLDSCKSIYCTDYFTSVNNLDIQVSMYDESTIRKTPYLGIDFIEKDGIKN